MSLNVGNLKNIIAGLMGKDADGNTLTPDDFEINGVDLLLIGLNNARRIAERMRSFRYAEINAGLIITSSGGNLSSAFSSQTVTTPNTPTFLSVVGTGAAAALPNAPCEYVELYNTTGVSITVDRGVGTQSFILPAGTFYTFHVVANANELRVTATNGASIPCECWGTGSVTTVTPVSVKEIDSVQLPDVNGDLFSIEFMTNDAWNTRIRQQVGRQAYDPSKTIAQLGISTRNPIAYQQGQTIFLYPASQFTFPTTVVMNVTRFMPDYTEDTDTDFFTEFAPEYLQWQGVLEVNKLYQQFVQRQEGTVNEEAIASMAQAALSALLIWDDGINDSTSTPKPKPQPAPAAKPEAQ